MVGGSLPLASRLRVLAELYPFIGTSFNLAQEHCSRRRRPRSAATSVWRRTLPEHGLVLQQGGAGVAGVVLGTLGAGCAACGSAVLLGLLSLLGVSTSQQFLPFDFLDFALPYEVVLTLHYLGVAEGIVAAKSTAVRSTSTVSLAGPRLASVVECQPFQREKTYSVVSRTLLPRSMPETQSEVTEKRRKPPSTSPPPEAERDGRQVELAEIVDVWVGESELVGRFQFDWATNAIQRRYGLNSDRDIAKVERLCEANGLQFEQATIWSGRWSTRSGTRRHGRILPHRRRGVGGTRRSVRSGGYWPMIWPNRVHSSVGVSNASCTSSHPFRASMR